MKYSYLHWIGWKRQFGTHHLTAASRHQRCRCHSRNGILFNCAKRLILISGFEYIYYIFEIAYWSSVSSVLLLDSRWPTFFAIVWHTFTWRNMLIFGGISQYSCKTFTAIDRYFMALLSTVQTILETRVEHQWRC